ncbi:hypothetical protein A374_03254 [Fictibacillus macauensis ZFHKF-1]|uniref:Helicase Helix-turn-helix domain-containing protein n=1 Tax=Fictibacillus macauensis ZFHKF-1 TaxID=1196324 RepID=I8UI42_9BACL|nr:helix-turn-helix domain-containing protein [Fictibacillus macauensis]EIT86555.1 hypothetical protein A374_03254 [Fictibacillus macauensis ZFHKF-1]
MQQFLILFAIGKLNGERSLSGVLHLLNGKKTSQTLTDGTLFHASFLFSALPALDRATLETEVKQLQANGWVRSLSAETYCMTSLGTQALQTWQKKHPYLLTINSLKYRKAETLFFNVVSLYVQSLAHVLHNDTRFLPICNDFHVQRIVKRCMPKRSERQASADQHYQEWLTLLNQLDEKSATLFVLRMSHRTRTGLTIEQLADQIALSKEEVSLRFRAVLHHFLQEALQQPTLYPMLHTLAAASIGVESVPLTQSATKTYELLQQGMTPQEILRRRNIKRSTLEDHLVEAAIHVPTFSIDAFVSKDEQQAIQTAFTTLKTKKLKTLKEALQDVSYFKIRLVLGKKGSE